MQRRHYLPTILVVIGAGAAIAGCGSSGKSGQATTAAAASATSTAAASDVKTGSTSLGTVLVDSKGMTLYHLTGEQNGKFICTSASCLQLWHPLLTHGGQAPQGSVGSLGTVQRPDGRMQITYKGMPLYTFAQDAKAGDAKGQGFKDVGTWTVIKSKGAAAPAAPAPAPAPKPSTSTGGGSGGYGY